MPHADPLIDKARAWTQEGQGVVLVTVTETWGSSPCPAGSRMVINEKVGFEGSVSGGCIESEVISESLEIIKDGGHRVLEYGVSDEIGQQAGLACGGTIHVLAEKLDDALLAELSGEKPSPSWHRKGHHGESESRRSDSGDRSSDGIPRPSSSPSSPAPACSPGARGLH